MCLFCHRQSKYETCNTCLVEFYRESEQLTQEYGRYERYKEAALHKYEKPFLKGLLL